MSSSQIPSIKRRRNICKAHPPTPTTLLPHYWAHWPRLIIHSSADSVQYANFRTYLTLNSHKNFKFLNDTGFRRILLCNKLRTPRRIIGRFFHHRIDGCSIVWKHTYIQIEITLTIIMRVASILLVSLAVHVSAQQRHEENNSYLRLNRRVIGEKIVFLDEEEQNQQGRYLSSKSGSKSGSGSR